jgi:transcriptional regulator
MIRRVARARGNRGREIADCRDAVAAYANVRAIRRRASAIENHSAAQNEIELGCELHWIPFDEK